MGVTNENLQCLLPRSKCVEHFALARRIQHVGVPHLYGQKVALTLGTVFGASQYHNVLCRFGVAGLLCRGVEDEMLEGGGGIGAPVDAGSV